MKKIIHSVAGAFVILCIATFWLSTILSELSGSRTTITLVKGAIPWGFLLLIPALMTTGASGFALARDHRDERVEAKIRRMPWIVANGVLLLIPSALFLACKAKAGEFDSGFYAVQALELLAGAANLVLLGFSMRDGLKSSGRLHRETDAAAQDNQGRVFIYRQDK